MHHTLRAVNRVTVAELNDGDACIGHRLELAAQHLQYVLVCQKRAGEMET